MFLNTFGLRIPLKWIYVHTQKWARYSLFESIDIDRRYLTIKLIDTDIDTYIADTNISIQYQEKNELKKLVCDGIKKLLHACTLRTIAKRKNGAYIGHVPISQLTSFIGVAKQLLPIVMIEICRQSVGYESMRELSFNLFSHSSKTVNEHGINTW